MLNKFFLSCKVFATVMLVGSGMYDSVVRPEFMWRDVLTQGVALYIIWFMGGKKKKNETK